jgi:hypothetical protein
MSLNVDLDVARIHKSLVEIQSGLDTPMVVTPESSINTRIAALANTVGRLTQVVDRIATELKHGRR